MANTQYIALLRGINVGGENIIKMAELKVCFEHSGYENVATYIQSGNVLFETAEMDRVDLTRQVEQAISQTFSSYNARVVLRTLTQLKSIVQEAPPGFGSEPEVYRYDVIYIKEPLTTQEAMRQVSIKPEVDEAWAGADVLYFSRLSARASQSRLTRLISLPIYQDMTIRNWNTTVKILGLMEARKRG